MYQVLFGFFKLRESDYNLIFLPYFSAKINIVGAQTKEQFFWAPKTNVKIDDSEKNQNFTLSSFVYL